MDGTQDKEEQKLHDKFHNYHGKHWHCQPETTSRTFTYDEDGNRISETERSCKKAETTFYKYTVENRLEAVYEKGHLLMAAAYDGDGNRVFQLNYNPEAEGNCHKDCRDAWGCYEEDRNKEESGKNDAGKNDSKNESGKNETSAEAGKNDNGKNDTKDNSPADSSKKTNEAETYCYDDKGGVLFPEDYKLGKCERNLFDKAYDFGHGDDYELIEYINDVNREYTEVLVEQSVHGRTETSYIYGVDRLSMDSFTGHSGYYLYDPRGIFY